MNSVLKRLAVCLGVVLSLAACSGNGDSPPSDGSEQPTAGATQGIDTAGAEGDLAVGLQAAVEGRHDDAIAAYNRVLEQEPDNVYALYNIGQVEQARGKNAEAENFYRQALETDPDYTPALFNLAIVRTARGDFAEAAELYQQVTEIEPQNANAFLNLGFALQEQGEDDEARAAWDQAIELDPALEERIPE